MIFLPALGTRPCNSLDSFQALFLSTLLCDPPRTLSPQNPGSTILPGSLPGYVLSWFPKFPSLGMSAPPPRLLRYQNPVLAPAGDRGWNPLASPFVVGDHSTAAKPSVAGSPFSKLPQTLWGNSWLICSCQGCEGRKECAWPGLLSHTTCALPRGSS